VSLSGAPYTVKKYIAYNNKGVQVMEAYLESDNELVIEHENITTFYFPISQGRVVSEYLGTDSE